MSNRDWFALLNVAIIVLSVLVALSKRLPRRLRLAGLVFAATWGLLLLLDDFFSLTVLPGSWGLSGSALFFWMTGTAWHTRFLTKNRRAIA